VVDFAASGFARVLFNGAATAEPGGGQMMTYREYLREGFFDELEKLKAAGAERIVFGFDN
jgi:hypothetical protein